MTAPPAERRKNRPLRDQAQAWFDTLKLHAGEFPSAAPITESLQSAIKIEDLMRTSPAHVQQFLDIVWNARKTARFADLFLTEAGAVAEQSTEVLARSQKSFDEVVIAHLKGTMRLTCERLQKEWLVVQRLRRQSPLNRIPVVGALLRALGLLSPPKVDLLLAAYSRRGLYEELKSCLYRREQFDLIEALSALPTRTARLFGPVIGVLDSPELIRTVGKLDNAMAKIAIEMAEAFVLATAKNKSDTVDLTVPRGKALAGVLSTEMQFLNAAIDHRRFAREAIEKLAPVVAEKVWTLCSDPNALRRVAECPAPIAKVLKELTVDVNEQVSIALSKLGDSPLGAAAMTTLRRAAGDQTFLAWIREERFALVWRQLVHKLGGLGDVSPKDEMSAGAKANVKAACQFAVGLFADVASAQQLAA